MQNVFGETRKIPVLNRAKPQSLFAMTATLDFLSTMGSSSVVSNGSGTKLHSSVPRSTKVPHSRQVDGVGTVAQWRGETDNRDRLRDDTKRQYVQDIKPCRHIGPGHDARSGGRLRLGHHRSEAPFRAIVIKGGATATSEHELADIDEARPCPFHCADPEEYVAEGRIPLIGQTL